MEEYQLHDLEWFKERIHSIVKMVRPTGEEEPMIVNCIPQCRFLVHLETTQGFKFFDIENDNQ